MPKISVPTDSLKGLPALPPGIYTVRLDGFKPKKSKKGDSVNLNPVLKVINDPNGLNDRHVPENLNSQAGWVHQDFVHAFGHPMTITGNEASIPGDFQGPDDNPEQWNYIGPLVGAVGRIEVVQVPNDKGGTRSNIKRYFCAIPGCQERHSESLV